MRDIVLIVGIQKNQGKGLKGIDIDVCFVGDMIYVHSVIILLLFLMIYMMRMISDVFRQRNGLKNNSKDNKSHVLYYLCI